MTRESTDVDTAEQVIDSFRILAADKVGIFLTHFMLNKKYNFLFHFPDVHIA